MSNDDTEYSMPCKIVNNIAKKMVNIDPIKLPYLFPSIKEWWLYVTATPEANKIIVFVKGSSNGFIASIPAGGQLVPTSIIGDKDEWKYVQNMARKNNASDNINKPIPIFKPLCTAEVWSPK